MIPITYCGNCYFCQHGFPANCELYGQSMGINKNGFFAEYVAIRQKSLVPLPDDIGNEEAAIIEPVALAIHVMDSLKPNLGDWATIIGQGPIGLLMTQIAKLKGCRVIAIDLEDYRLQLSKKYGAEFCINATQEKVIKRVKEITKRGSDVVVEAAGKIRAVQQTPFLVRKAGKVALVGEFRGRMNFEDADDAIFFTMYLSPVEYPLAVDLIKRKLVDVKGLTTHRFKLADFSEAIKTADTTSEKAIKVLVAA